MLAATSAADASKDQSPQSRYASNPTTQQSSVPAMPTPLAEMFLFKEQDYFLKRAQFFKPPGITAANNFRHHLPLTLHDFLPTGSSAMAMAAAAAAAAAATSASAASSPHMGSPMGHHHHQHPILQQQQQQPSHHHSQSHHVHQHHQPKPAAADTKTPSQCHSHAHMNADFGPATAQTGLNDPHHDAHTPPGRKSHSASTSTPTPPLPQSSQLQLTAAKRTATATKYPSSPMAGTSSSASTSSHAVQQQKSPVSTTSSSSATSPPLMLLRPLPESALLQSSANARASTCRTPTHSGHDTACTIEEETKCVVCMATFPSVWLLEQHAALQHAHSGGGGHDEKPFICEQCGQSYRYRSAYVKHREQNHRARLPADKLFTCDVCGMQFRYLKSFKKHRLNHALERLHGKNERRAMGGPMAGGHQMAGAQGQGQSVSQRASGAGGSELVVSSSNEMIDVADLPFAIKAEMVGDDDDDGADEMMDEQQSMLRSHRLAMLVASGASMDGEADGSTLRSAAQNNSVVANAAGSATARASADDHGRISSSAMEMDAMSGGGAMSGSGSCRPLMGDGGGSGMGTLNNNMDARNFILKVS